MCQMKKQENAVMWHRSTALALDHNMIDLTGIVSRCTTKFGSLLYHVVWVCFWYLSSHMFPLLIIPNFGGFLLNQQEATSGYFVSPYHPSACARPSAMILVPVACPSAGDFRYE